MSFTPPSEAAILHAYPQVQDLSLITTGGFKVVYKAKVAGKDEAFKLIELPVVTADPDSESFRNEFAGRIKRETEALKKCNVPELVKLGGLACTEAEINGKQYLGYSEELLSGFDLWKLISAPGNNPSEREAKSLFRSLVLAIKEMWSHGYVHRDIKPHNIIRLSDPRRPFVLLDLGIAFALNETHLTFGAENRYPVATYRYLAPELLNPNFRENLDFRSDLYTTALTVFEYSTKKHPLARTQDDLMQTISRAVLQPPLSLKGLRPDYSVDFCDMIDQLLKKKPALRPGNLALLLKRSEA